MKPSIPVAAMLIGIIAGFAVGWLVVSYYEIEPWLDRVAVIASVLMVAQLLGSTVGAAIGKPHDKHSTD